MTAEMSYSRCTSGAEDFINGHTLDVWTYLWANHVQSTLVYTVCVGVGSGMVVGSCKILFGIK
jgi:hypothetical protein